jgi:hypothetical protein
MSRSGCGRFGTTAAEGAVAGNGGRRVFVATRAESLASAIGEVANAEADADAATLVVTAVVTAVVVGSAAAGGVDGHDVAGSTSVRAVFPRAR